MFLVSKILGFYVLLTNLMIVEISGGHFVRHLKLQLFEPYLKLALFFMSSIAQLEADIVSKFS